ncbi:RNAPII degradation factor Def1 [Purpureocillium lilacinum]|uniref:RNA polymerase II degradation factor 1 n=1 Tax=Purpureocillium lilacinum TaxID=33203 RepID=A0A179GWS4_PURLI|nr:RNAPII degradation factor Def1 [Purpureocillium lilacinum]
MSEVASRPSASRGRGSGRGGRGGFAGRGGRRPNGDKSDHKAADDGLGAFDDEGDFADLRKQYGGKTSVIREMFPDWSEVDVLFALQETNGDENEAVARIAEGTISQWGEVSKPKKTTRAKGKDATTSAPAAAEQTSTAGRPARGGRAASEGGRGRGRGSDRGGAARGGRGRSTHAGANGARNKETSQLSVPTEESSAWDNEKPQADKPEPKTAAAEKPTVSTTTSDAPKAAAPQAKTWASMLRQSTAPKPVPAPKEAPAPKPIEPVEPQVTAEPVQPEPEPATEEAEEATPVAQHAEPVQVPAIAQPDASLPPTKDELTETNLEQVVDDSNPPATGTAASTAADSWDPRQSPVSANATPLSAAQQQHQAQRAAASGFATSAIKATAERSTRAPSYQRRVLDQEEAVRMPGNREVDRAAVRFGAFSLNGGEEDVDGEREEPETRAQPPADSPVAHPRASLPPVSQPVAVPEPFSQKPGAAAPTGPAGNVPTGPAAHAQVPQAAVPGAQQYGRFGHGVSQEAAPAAQKPVDPFAQQSTPVTQAPFDSYAAQTSQPPAQQPAGAFSSAPSDYSNYYTANQQERNPYNYYGQQYGAQQGVHGQHDGPPSQQRAFSGYAQADNLSQYPQSGAMHNQPRFGGSGEGQNSGHSTPNLTAQSQQQQPQPQGQQSQQAQQQQATQQPQQQGAPGAQPQSHGQYANYNHPYYTNPYYHQYYSGYGQSNFGPYAGKGGMYGQPYGVSPNAPYDHTSSPGAFGPSSLHRESGLGSGLGDYGRAGSGQAGNQPGLGGSSFGGAHDSYARGASSFQSQGQGFGSQTQPATGGSTDDLKPFGDAKTGSGPSPALGGGPRPGSATNTAPSGQSGLPPPQTSQMGGAYGGYPSHLQGHGLHGSGAYGMGAGAGANQHGNSPYGSYNQGFGSGYYGGQQQQQRGGWGGNYH